MMITLIYILLACLIILMNGFFVLGEFALVKVRRTRLQELAKKGGYKEKLMLQAHEKIDDYLSSIQIAITMTSLALGWVGEPSVGKLLSWFMPWLMPFLPTALFYTISFVLSFLLITSMHVVFGEQVPKLLSIKYPEKTLSYIIIPLHYFYVVTRLFRKFLVYVAYKTLSVLGIDPHAKEAPISQEELRMMFSSSQEGGKLSLRRLMMFENLFDFEQVKLKEIMTPKSKISALKKGNTWQENFAIINARKFSRYPLYENTIDDATEYVSVKEMSLESIIKKEAPIEEKYTYPILNLDENTSVESALREFQKTRRHLAFVRNSKDQVCGLVSLEDVLEELVGEIRDEYEKQPVFLLSNFLVAHASIPNLKSTEKFACFDEILDSIYKEHPVFSKIQASQFIKQREKLMSCALAKGVAFPHARIASLSKAMVAIGVSKKGIIFDKEQSPVHLIFLILTPFKEPAAQLKILAELAAISQNKVVTDRILKSKTPAEIAEIILAFENTVPD